MAIVKSLAKDVVEFREKIRIIAMSYQIRFLLWWPKPCS
jgi:hypothetical protein